MDSGIFNLYKSGIHISTVSVMDSQIQCVNRDNHAGVSNLKLREIFSTAEAFDKDLRMNADRISAGGSIFAKHEDKSYPDLVFWVQRGVKHPVDIMVHKDQIIGFIQQNREHTMMLIREGFEGITPHQDWIDPAISQPDSAIEFAGDFFVPTENGIKLATSVWLPKHKEGAKFPVILVRTPYGRKRLASEELRYVQRGYALVAQDVRGREDSEGEWIPFAHEAEDGHATLNWIGSQEWCNGRIGMIGASYGGFVQWAAASKKNPYLKAMVSMVTAGSPFGDIPRKGGTYMSGILAWCFAMAGKKVDPSAMNRDDWEDVIRQHPIKDIPRRALGQELHLWNTWASNPHDNEFWKRSDWTRRADAIDVPALIITGWCDDNFTGSMEAWSVVNQAGKSPSRLVVGAWPHDVNTTRDLHGVSFGNNSLYYNIELLHLKWFDRFLKGTVNEVEEPRVTYYSLGSNEWRIETNWPPARVQKVSLHFSSQSSLSSKVESEESYKEYVYDPLNPAPHVIDLAENEMNIPGNYKDVERRDDVITFTSCALEQEVEIAGHVTAVFYASSSALDTDFVVRLLDVDPLGNSIKISQGVLRARYRKSFSEPELLVPGAIERYEVALDDIANVFLPGHRIRVSITSSAHKYIFENHNTGNDPATDSVYQTAIQRVYWGGPYDSRIEFLTRR